MSSRWYLSHFLRGRLVLNYPRLVSSSSPLPIVIYKMKSFCPAAKGNFTMVVQNTLSKIQGQIAQVLSCG